MPQYVPSGPRAEALLSLEREWLRHYVAGLGGKVVLFDRPIYGQPVVKVMVRLREPSLTFEEHAPSPLYGSEYFYAIELRRSDGRRFWAYCNEPRHLDEFLLLANGPKYMVTVQDVQRPAIEAAPAPEKETTP